MSWTDDEVTQVEPVIPRQRPRCDRCAGSGCTLVDTPQGPWQPTCWACAGTGAMDVQDALARLAEALRWTESVDEGDVQASLAVHRSLARQKTKGET